MISNLGTLKQKKKVDNAIILAAGFGSRMVPITYEKPKALIPIFGTPLIERQIEQLIEKDVSDIIIVVGHMKESFDYLVKKYSVKLIENPEFAIKNNLSSLYIVRDYLRNSYVTLSDLYFDQNIFNREEEKNWIGCKYFDGETEEWCVTTDEAGIIESIIIGGKDSAALVGPAYFTEELSEKFKDYLDEYYHTEGTEGLYWENILIDKIAEIEMYENDLSGNLHEFETLTELKDYDESFKTNSGSEILEYIAKIHKATEEDIANIIPLTSGMTNQSMIYEIAGEKYVFRLPGAGTDKLIDRSCEKRTYELLQPYDITDEIVYFDDVNGRKISKYYEGARPMNPTDDDDFVLSMNKIRVLHEQGMKVDYRFDIEGKIDFYQKICDEIDAIRFTDIEETKMKVGELLKFRNELAIPEILCHGDTVYNNILLLENGDCRVIDWEYCGAGDPIMDVAMFDIYAYYDREHIDRSLELYLGKEPSNQERARLYLYIALGGYLWSLWTEYKEAFGDNFGDYSRTMYNYLKDYYDILKNEGFLW